MVDNKGWRKKIGRPPGDVATELIDRRRHGWRKTIAGSRPTTPMAPVPQTPNPEDMEDERSVGSEISTPRRDSKPKLIRYTSLFTTHKEEAAGPVFSEPWSIDHTPSQEDPWSYVDPIVVMESIHSHMCRNCTLPIPLHYNSGLFQLFDDYRKLRSQKDLLFTREKEACEYMSKMTAQKLESEARYASEIRRFELLLTRETTGTAGPTEVHQNPAVDCAHQHGKNHSIDRSLDQYIHNPAESIDGDIESDTQQVLLQRAVSPSGKMVALSRQLSNIGPQDFLVGAVPDTKEESLLSQKVRSELDLTSLSDTHLTESSPRTAALEQTEVTQAARKRATLDGTHLLEYFHNCDALIALKELGILVARQRGLDVSNFVNGLMGLLTPTEVAASICEPNVCENRLWNPTTTEISKISADDVTPQAQLQRSQTQPNLHSGRNDQRHLSFETGDDQAQGLEVNLRSYASLSHTNTTGPGPLSFSTTTYWFPEGLDQCNDDTNSLPPSIGVDVSKSTMIPSPVQTVGRIRRENSVSSLQSVFVKNIEDDGYNSRPNIHTTFRKTSNASISIKPKRKSSPTQNLHTVESPLGSEERSNKLANRYSAAALAASRAVEARNGSLSRIKTQPVTDTLTSRKHKPIV